MNTDNNSQKNKKNDNLLKAMRDNLNSYKYPAIILTFLHSILPYFIVLILLFTNDIINLIILLFILKLITLANYKCNNCPITTIEENLGTKNTMMDITKDFLTIDKSKHSSSVTLEWLWIAMMLTIIKIFGLIIYKMIRRSFINIKCKK